MVFFFLKKEGNVKNLFESSLCFCFALHGFLLLAFLKKKGNVKNLFEIFLYYHFALHGFLLLTFLSKKKSKAARRPP